MRSRSHAIRIITVLSVVLASVAATSGEDEPPVPYPEGFRSWTLVRSLIVGPDHPSFPRRGGIHHYYASAEALTGYRTGQFPDGSIIVDEGVFTREGEGPTKGLLFEGERRSLDVMMKSAERFRSTGGWGYEHFDGDDRTGTLTESGRAACSACHSKAPSDHVFTRMRP